MPGYHVWDSWYVLNEDGSVADFKGHKVLIALYRPVEGGDGAGEKIGVFVETPEGYVARGPLFKKSIYSDIREWSGSTILRDDGRLQTFYTISSGFQEYGVWQTKQRFATAIQQVTFDDAGFPAFDEPELHQLLIEPDGLIYETAEQAAQREARYPSTHKVESGNDQTENHCFRDPKFFKDADTGKAYIVFEGNTSPNSLWATGTIKEKYFGGSPEGYQPTPDDLKANGCVGVMKLTNEDYSYGVFCAPWLTANLVTDEIERINVIKATAGYYLFVAGHGNKNAMRSEMPDLTNRDYMLGFHSSTLFGPLTPLNGSGVVVQQKSLGGAYSGQEQNQQYTYSWILVPTDTADVYQCVSYANYSNVDGKLAPVKTAGPSVFVKIDDLSTCIVDKKYDILAK